MDISAVYVFPSTTSPSKKLAQLHWWPQSAPSSKTPPRRPLFGACACQGSWQWQSLAYCLTLHPSPPTCPAPPVTNINFNNTLHWLPAHVLQLLPPLTIVDCPPSTPTFPDVTTFSFDDDSSYSHHNDGNTLALPTMFTTSNTPLIPCPPSTRIISLPCPPPISIDICKLYSQNVHGLWCWARDPDGCIIPNCKQDITKLEHLSHRMQVDNINEWLIQETF